MLDPMHVLLCHPDEATRTELFETFATLGDHTIDIQESASSLVDAALASPPDLIVIGVDLPDFDGITALMRIGVEHAIPAIVVTPKTSLAVVQRAAEDHVMAYLIEPIDAEQVRPTVLLVLRRFEEFREIQSQVESLKNAMEDRKIIERAKGILIARGGLSEEDAHRALQRQASDKRVKMIEAAQAVLREAEANS